ncbi:MAG: [FeFe] hydrogenase H-cluster radical SAM maturase HydE [Bacteroidetes bacterium]|nr:[FeFe] hydrogenase H-cluster radical SAM maturase HydE [Bacteroidota bacterium]
MPRSQDYTREALVVLLSSQGDQRLDLFRRADALRRDVMGDEVFVRGIVEFSNVCANDCFYCGIRRSNRKVKRYVISPDEVMSVARNMAGCSQTTIVLQSGEMPTPRADADLGNLIRRIKRETSLAVTVSVGNRPRDVYAYWQACGMDRYLLRFEASDPELFARLRADCTLEQRLQCLRDLKALGVQTGSGFMIGLPGETLEVLADNILLCRLLDLDMIGIGPFIPHPDTPLGTSQNAYVRDSEMFFTALAVLRLVNPDAHIPATTAFDAVFPKRGRELALQRGANIFMPNATPAAYRKEYLLYPNKPCIDEGSDQCSHCVVLQVRSIGRTIGRGPGDSIKKQSAML